MDRLDALTVGHALDVAEPTTAAVRAWARDAGLDVPAKGRLRPEIRAAYDAAHATAVPDEENVSGS